MAGGIEEANQLERLGQTHIDIVGGPLQFQERCLIPLGQHLLACKIESHGAGTYQCDRQPTEKEIEDMIFGWAIEHGVTSNSVIYVKDGCTTSIGTGEQDRVGVAEIAVQKAYKKYADMTCFDLHNISYAELEAEVKNGQKDSSLLEEIDEKVTLDKAGLAGSVMISDAFFPFRDGVDVGIKEGITAILQPGGSLRDYESIEACNEASPQVAMMYTGQRSFKH